MPRPWPQSPPVGAQYLNRFGCVERYMGWAVRLPKPEPKKVPELPPGDPKEEPDAPVP